MAPPPSQDEALSRYSASGDGENESKVYPFMAAIEFIHTYSLVHDDLPAMDDDEFRRGQKTTHAKYGEDIGILAGDGLLNYAYEVMSEAVVKSPDAAEAMAVIAKKAGAYGMVGGQTVDVVNEGKKLDIETINFIHNLKTAALIEICTKKGGLTLAIASPCPHPSCTPLSVHTPTLSTAAAPQPHQSPRRSCSVHCTKCIPYYL